MATFDLTAAGDALKTEYSDPISNQIIAKSDFLSWFEQNSQVKESDFGQYVEASSIYAGPEGVGARGEDDYIPVATSPSFKKQQIYLRYLYGTVQMTKQVMRQMKKGRAAFDEWSRSELREMEKSIRNDLDRQLFGFGAGHVARAEGSSTDATLEVDRAYGITGMENPAKLFRVNGLYTFFGSADATNQRTGGGTTSGKVTSRDRTSDPQIITFDAVPNDISSGDYIIRGDDLAHSGQDSSGANKEIMGLLGHVDDGSVLSTYFGATRSSFEFLQAHVIDGSAAPYNGQLTELLLMHAADEIIDYGNGEPDAIVTSRGVKNNYFANIRADRTFNDPRGMTGGPRGDLAVDIGDREVVLRAARQAPNKNAFMLTRNSFQRLHNVGWEWDDTDGSVFKQYVDGSGRKDVWSAFGRWWLEVFCKSPQQNARITGLTESVA